MCDRIEPRQEIRFTPTTLTKWFSPLVLVLGIVCTGEGTVAQIVPDETLGNERSRLAPDAEVRGLPADLIEGGAERGANLFHSFEQFNVGEGQRVYFANPVGIENILGRVTGGDVSDILGTLGVDGAASLFLLNPNGIVFGENARLDVAGSFVASTADSFVFGDGLAFSAANPEAPPLLTINVTPGLQYGENRQGTIENAGTLEVGWDLTLSAGNLDLQGQLWAGGDLSLQAQDTVRVRDSVEHPFIAAARGELLVQGNEAVDIFALNHASSGLYSGGNMVLRSASPVGADAHYWSGGSFRIEQLDGNLGDLYSPNDPIIRSLSDVSFNLYSGTSLHILSGGEVNIGTVVITGAEAGVAGVDFIRETVQLSNGTQIDIDGSLQPTLDIRAGVAPASIGVPGVTGVNFPTDIFLGQVSLTDAPTSADITIANALILAANGLVFVTNQYQPNTALTGGDITINAGNIGVNGGSVILDSRGNIAITDSTIGSFSGVDNAGDITLLANESISLTNSSLESDSLADVGNSGDITVLANGTVSLIDSRIASLSRNAGNSGNISLAANESISLTDSEIGSLANIGNSGNISLAANETVSLSNRLVVSATLESGDGGDMNIQARQLLLTNGAQMSVSALGEGNGGSLIVQASESVEIIGINNTDGPFPYPSSLTAQTAGAGDGGNVEITTPVFRVTDGAAVNMTTFGEGKGGSLIVNASELVEVTGTSADGQFRSTLDGQTLGAGDGGNIEITTPVFRVSDDALVNVNTRGEGKAGNVIVNAFESVELIGAGLGAQTTSTGNGGNVEITTPVLRVTDGGGVSVSTLGEGQGGNVIVDASELVQVMGSSVDGQRVSTLIAVTSNQGEGGDVQITTPVLMVTDGGVVSVGTLGEGKGGDLIVDASEEVQVMGISANGQIPSSLDASTFGTGDGGNVEITAPRLLVTDGAQVSAITLGEGNAGSLIVNTSELVQVMGTSTDDQIRSALTAETIGIGDGGNLDITTPVLRVTDGAVVTVSTSGEGKGGSLIVNASELVQVMGTSTDDQIRSALTAETIGIGDGGNLEITTPVLRVTDGAQVSVSTLGEGNAGSLIVNASEAVQLMGTSANGQIPGGLGAVTFGIGDGGNVEITTPWLLVTDGAAVNVSTSGEGNAGSLIINASEAVQLMGTSADGQFSSGLSAVTFGTGDGGNVDITTPWLLVTDGAVVDVSTFDEGKGGSLIVNASEAVQVMGISADGQFPSGLGASSRGTGDGGSVEITTPGLLVTDGARVNVSTFGEGNAGSLIINASKAVQLTGTSADGQFGSALTAATVGTGDGGNVEITAPVLLVTDGAGVTASTTGEGNGGSLIVNSSEQVQLSGPGGLFVDAIAGGTAGDLIVNTNEMSVTDSAQVTVSSLEGQAGNLTIIADTLSLNNGTLFAETGISGPEGGANITLQDLDFLFLENESLISANALEDANGGNVTIDADFIVAKSPTGPEGSDITANAVRGNGGRVSVTSKGGLFGIEFRPQRTPLNDITVSSQFGLAGDFIENTPGIDPSQGLATLPSNLVDPESLIDRSCTPGSAALQSSFIITGRGGIPTSPTEPLSGDAVVSEWVTLDTEEETTAATETPTNSTSATPERIIEAQGWIMNERGQVVLVANAPTVSPQTPRKTSPSCEDIRANAHE